MSETNTRSVVLLVDDDPDVTSAIARLSTFDDDVVLLMEEIGKFVELNEVAVA